MDLGSWLALAAVAVGAAFAVRGLRRGKGSCGGNCCGDCRACARKRDHGKS